MALHIAEKLTSARRACIATTIEVYIATRSRFANAKRRHMPLPSRARLGWHSTPCSPTSEDCDATPSTLTNRTHNRFRRRQHRSKRGSEWAVKGLGSRSPTRRSGPDSRSSGRDKCNNRLKRSTDTTQAPRDRAAVHGQANNMRGERDA